MYFFQGQNIINRARDGHRHGGHRFQPAGTREPPPTNSGTLSASMVTPATVPTSCISLGTQLTGTDRERFEHQSRTAYCGFGVLRQIGSRVLPALR